MRIYGAGRSLVVSHDQFPAVEAFPEVCGQVRVADVHAVLCEVLAEPLDVPGEQ